MGLRAYALGWELVFGVWGEGLRFWDLEFRVQGLVWNFMAKLKCSV